MPLNFETLPKDFTLVGKPSSPDDIRVEYTGSPPLNGKNGALSQILNATGAARASVNLGDQKGAQAGGIIIDVSAYRDGNPFTRTLDQQ